jgi:hypothetical protein
MEKPLLEKLHSSVEFSRLEMPNLIKKIRYRIKPIDLRACYGQLSRDHLKIGVYDYFVEGNTQSFKQNLYISSNLKLAAISIDSYQQFTAMELYYALFSDHPELIATMASMETQELISGRNNPLYPGFILHMWQLAILGDYKTLQAKVQNLVQHGRKKDHKNIDFFTLLIKGDKVALESLIHEEANIKSADPLIENFMSFFACMESKICWFKGIEVQINHPLVPMELMPIKLLEHYDDIYDFLLPDWQPEQKSFFGKFFGKQ